MRVPGGSRRVVTSGPGGGSYLEAKKSTTETCNRSLPSAGGGSKEAEFRKAARSAKGNRVLPTYWAVTSGR